MSHLSPAVRARLAEIRDIRRVHAELTRFILLAYASERRATDQGIALRHGEGWRREWERRRSNEMSELSGKEKEASN